MTVYVVPNTRKTKYFRPSSHREEVAAFADPRANADSTLQFAFRDAFPLRELQASQPTGGGYDFQEIEMTIHFIPNIQKTKDFRPRSHREEVAAFGDPRANGDSTLNPAYRDAFPLRELQASQPTGDGSHREEVAAFRDPRANGDSTLHFAFRDAFPLRELQASQPTGDG
ncbi:hypothetical protein V1478_008863 [Vespula squamosa]|uniref:Uncharacterized protein n=1 Tax=Vespula squamosa TaxID=30214 RepID=A0ABD2AV45_VESSQ